MLQQDVALKLAAGPQACSDIGDLKVERVGVDQGIESYSARDHAGSDIGGVVGVNGTVNSEFAVLALCCQIQSGDAFGSVGIAGRRLHELEIEVALCCCFPVRVSEVEQLAGDVQPAVLGTFAVGCELERAEIDSITSQID